MTLSKRPTVFGATYSTYVRTVRLALHEKGVLYELVDVDVYAPQGPPFEYLKIHPFGRIPSFEHGVFRLYEAVPIARYVDEAFEGPPLQPTDIYERARMNQIISVLDSYAYRTLVWDIYVERTGGTPTGRLPDEDRIARALPRARLCLEALSGLMGDRVWLAGSALTLADLHAAPIFAYFLRTPEGQDLMTRVPPLMRWWGQVEKLASITATEPIRV
jgi:glutathione S-transferase